jgi:hypothetical protein
MNSANDMGPLARMRRTRISDSARECSPGVGDSLRAFDSEVGPAVMRPGAADWM